MFLLHNRKKRAIKDKWELILVQMLAGNPEVNFTDDKMLFSMWRSVQIVTRGFSGIQNGLDKNQFTTHHLREWNNLYVFTCTYDMKKDINWFKIMCAVPLFYPWNSIEFKSGVDAGVLSEASPALSLGNCELLFGIYGMLSCAVNVYGSVIR